MQHISAAREDYAMPAWQSDLAPTCDWASLQDQLLEQWVRLTRTDLRAAGPNRKEIAALVQRKYGVSARLIENYLSNLERTLPVL